MEVDAQKNIGSALVMEKKVSEKYMFADDAINNVEEDEMDDGDSQSDWNQIEMKNLMSIFKILFISFILGTLILLIEITSQY